VAQAMISDPKRHIAYEPLYDVDPHTGASVEIFYADRAVANSFGMRDAGWFRWSCRRGCLPDGMPTGPFSSSYLAYRDFVTRTRSE
jgi:hypothetical protein